MTRRSTANAAARAFALQHDTTLVDVRCDRCGHVQRNQLDAGCTRCGHGYGTYAKQR